MSPIPSTTAGRSLLLPLLVIAVLAAGLLAWWLRPHAEETLEGLTVEVTVVGADGKPVPRAQVQARYRPKWHVVGDDGTIVLKGVILRADDAATRDAVARALDARSPEHASRRPAVVTYTKEDGWQARFVLEPFGTVRLRIAGTNLPGVKAWVVTEGRGGAVECASGVAVARPGQPAAWRVFGSADAVDVRIEGAMGTAARTLRLESPATGFVREFGLDAEPAMPIRGKIAPATGSPDGEPVALPSLRGHMEVVELTEDGREVEHLPVWVQDDGSFEVSYAGEGRYVLTPVLYYAAVEPRRVQGGDTVDLTDVEPRPWLVLPPGELTAQDRPTPTMRLVRITDAGEEAVPSWSLFSEDEGWMISVPGPGRYRVHAARAGTKDLPPASGEATVEVEDAGPHPVELVLAPEPAGTVIVRLGASTTKGGADVEVEGRRATVLFAFGTSTTFVNLRAGPFAGRVLFTDRTLAVQFLGGDVTADGITEIEARGVVGGSVVLLGHGTRLAEDTRSRRLAWTGEDGPYGTPGEITLVREAGTRRWRSSRRLQPGRYRAVLVPVPPPDGRRSVVPDDDGEARTVELAIAAGETAVVEIDLE